MAIATLSTLAEAERIATEGESAKKNARIKKSYSNYLSTDYADEQFEGEATGYESVRYDDEGEDIAAAFNDRRGYRGHALSDRPGRKFGGRGREYSGTGASTSGEPRCFQCRQFGKTESIASNQLILLRPQQDQWSA